METRAETNARANARASAEVGAELRATIRATIWWRRLGATFLAGAVLDLAFGAGILLAPGALAPLLRVTVPSGPARVYLDLNGVFLLALGALYVAIWRAPRTLAAAAAIGGGLRLAGCVLFVASVAAGRADPFFLVIGGLEGLLGTAHLGLLARARRADRTPALDPVP